MDPQEARDAVTQHFREIRAQFLDAFDGLIHSTTSIAVLATNAQAVHRAVAHP